VVERAVMRPTGSYVLVVVLPVGSELADTAPDGAYVQVYRWPLVWSGSVSVTSRP
jgi:hypothetical protein